MKFYSLRKFSLIDYPGQISAVVFTYGCNFRCPYCHNPELVMKGESSIDIDEVKNSGLTESETLDFLKTRIGKLDGLAVTGGEPLLHVDLFDFLKKVKSLGFLVKVDTNGSFPDVLKKYINAGFVDYWAMDVKNSKAMYEQTIGVKVDFEKITRSIQLIRDNGVGYEFRTTVVPGLHDKKSVRRIGQLVKGARRFVLQNFRGGRTLDKSFSKKAGFSDADLDDFKMILEEFVNNVEIRN